MKKSNVGTYVCKKLGLYNFLTDRGFTPYRVAPDMRDCRRLVWLYDDSDEIRNAVEDYYAMDYSSIANMHKM